MWTHYSGVSRMEKTIFKIRAKILHVMRFHYSNGDTEFFIDNEKMCVAIYGLLENAMDKTQFCHIVHNLKETLDVWRRG